MAVAEHQLEHRVPVSGSKEIQSVARSFNQMADKLEEQETLRQNMLADVTHELRHPVHILQGSLRAILDGVYPLDMVEITRLLDQTHQLNILVDELHQLALAEAEELSLHKQESNLGKLVSDIIGVLDPMFTSKEIRTIVEIPPQAIVRTIDQVRMRQALQNVITNAFHRTPQGGEIEVSLANEADSVKIRVRDSGIGIPEEHLPHIFDRFYKADSSRDRENGGTGLGLAIAQAIIHSHGGEISAESQGEGRGSTFTIHIP
jgi:two-component system sensor histidine kinase BaeS